MHTITTNTDDTPVADVFRPNAQQKTLLITFIVFCLTAVAVAVAMFISSDIARRLLPYYGWPIIGFFYLGSLKHAIPPFLKRNPIPISKYFNAIGGTLCILICYGAFTAVLGWLTDDFGNPYLTVHVVQPIWTVIVPLIWLWLFRTHRKSTSTGIQNC
jgi:hypothetical protein